MDIQEAAVGVTLTSRRGGLVIALTIAVSDETGLAHQVLGDILDVAQDIIDGENAGDELGGAL